MANRAWQLPAPIADRVISMLRQGRRVPDIAAAVRFPAMDIRKFIRWKGLDKEFPRVNEPDRHRPSTEKQRAARVAVQLAVQNGMLKPPDKCEGCGLEPLSMDRRRRSVHAHHPDYDKPLDVMWLCTTCHQAWHRRNEPKNRGI
jgi:hypothetical protein